MIICTQFLFPLIVAAGFYLAPMNFKKTKFFALAGSLLYIGLCLQLFNFIPQSLGQIKEPYLLQTISSMNIFGITYTLAIDGLSASLILLNAVLLFIAIIVTWDLDTNKYRLYYFSLFSLTWTVTGSLLSHSLYAFYIFWEAMLVPLFILIGVFGGEDRRSASYKFFLYTAAGSFIMLAAMIFLSSASFEIHGTYDLTVESIKGLDLAFAGFWSPQSLVFWAFCLAMMVKVPIFPLHAWLPSAHVQAPTAGSIILAGILLKLGIYGLIRFVIPVYTVAVDEYRFFLIFLGVVGVIYGALTAMAQKDMKKVVAFSSISHMGYIFAGIFSLNEEGFSGALFQMISHGITTSGLFIAVHYLYVRRHTKDMEAYGGVAKQMPVFAVFFFLMLLGSMAVPLTNGFVGEFLIIWGVYKANIWLGALCALGVILGPIYLLNLYQQIMLGPIKEKEVHHMHDISLRECIPFALLAFFIIFYGIYPQALMNFYQGIMNIIQAGV